jgi:hypothetical protein
MPIATVVVAITIGAATKKPTDPLRVPGDQKRTSPITSNANATAIGIRYAMLLLRALRFGFIQSRNGPTGP